MSVTFKAKLDKRFEKQARGRIERFSFDVGVLQDRPHKVAKPASRGLKSFAGGAARKTGSKSSGQSIAEVSESLRKETRINFYTKPFSSRNNAEIVRFVASFFKLISQGGKLKEKKRLENLLQAVVRNPILRGDYGRNSKQTENRKGFNRFMIDTGQLFKAIVARVRIKSV